MTKNNEPKNLIDFISCLSVWEENTFLLYEAFSNKIELPLVKSLLLSIAEDSRKHSILLKGVADSMLKQGRPKDCAKKMGEGWQIADTIYEEISAKEKILDSELSQFSEKLAFMESIMGEEYYILIQLKTLQLMTQEINQMYKIDLTGLKSIFTGIINDEEQHRQRLEKIKQIVDEKIKVSDNSPAVKYQNPDAWIKSIPPTS